MVTYRERLLPGFGILTACLLFIPATALVLTPVNSEIAWPVAIALYLIIAIALVLMSPVVRVEDGKLYAGRATISIQELGDIELLGADALRELIGAKSDARNYLVVRGWIHRGVRIEISDPADPTPNWIITSRKPVALADAIQSARVAA